MRARLHSHICRVVVLMLTVFTVLSAQGADYVIVVDTSGSMKESISNADRRIRITTVQDELVKYLKDLPPNSRVHLIAFNSGIVSEKEWVLKTDGDMQEALDWVRNLTKLRFGDTYLWSALRSALRTATQFASQNTDQPVNILVLTDGQDNEPGGPSLEQVLKEFPLKIQKNEIQTSLILLGNVDIRSVGKAKDLGITVVQTGEDWRQIFPPVIKWSPEPARVGREISFFDTSRSTYQSYEWNVDGTAVGSPKALTYTFAKSGLHRVTLNVVGLNGRPTRSTATVPVSETDLTCDFVISASEVEPGQEVKLFSRATGNPDGYSWKVNGQEVAIKADHTVTFDKEGNYDVTLEVRDGTGKAVSSKKVIQVREPNPRMSFKYPVEVASGQPAQFVNTSEGRLVSWAWTFGDSETSTEQHPSHTYKNDGTAPRDFRVALQGKTITGKTFDSSPVSVRVLPVPPRELPPRAEFRILGESPYKAGLRIQLMDTSSGRIDAYSWSLGGEATSGDKIPEFTPVSTGEKIIRLVVTGPGGSSTNEQKLTIVPLYIPPGFTAVTVSPTKPRLNGDKPVTVTFKAAITGDYDTVRWNFGDGSTSSELKPSHTYTKATNHIVQVTARNAGGQEGHATVQVQVLPPPPWWHKALLIAGIVFAVWVLIVVPFFLKPALMPHKTVSIRSSVNHNLRLLAKRGGLNWLWPRNAITIGTQKSNDIRLASAGGVKKTFAVIKRVFGSDDYQLLPQQGDSVKLLEKSLGTDARPIENLVSVPSGKGRVLRDGDQIRIADETFSWAFPTKKRK